MKKSYQGLQRRFLEPIGHRLRQVARITEFFGGRNGDTGAPYLSFVAASYNVEPYMDRFLGSIFFQSRPITDFEIIIVDNGSTDRTGEIAQTWEARYPGQIRYIRQDTPDYTAARNVGLAAARGKWISFPDPSDYFHHRYFVHLLAELQARHNRPLLAVSTNVIFCYEDVGQLSDSHSLRFRFRKGGGRVTTDDLRHYIEVSAKSCWMDRDSIMRHALTFDNRTAPDFLDAHLINRLLLAEPGRAMSFRPRAIYYESLPSKKIQPVGEARKTPGYYLDQLEFGVIDLLKAAKETCDTVPSYIQRTAFNEVFARCRYLVDHDERINFLSLHERSRFQELLAEVMSYIEAHTIQEFDNRHYSEAHCVALLALFKSDLPGETAIEVRRIDGFANRVQFSYFSGADNNPLVCAIVDGEERMQLHPSQVTTVFMGKTYSREHLFWLDLLPKETIRFEARGAPCRIQCGSKIVGHKASLLQFDAVLRPKRIKRRKLEVNELRIRDHIVASSKKYEGSWVLMDRHDKADDNAEHLYRYLVQKGQADNAWFILSPSSSDWPRLEAEGFRLLALGSDEHFAAQANADFFVSSHADRYVGWPVERRKVADLIQHQFVFLQHGIIFNDLSRWLNRKDFRIIVTTTPGEYNAIAALDSPYRFSDREVRLTGMPRHDALLAKASDARSILIMPTWRRTLTDESAWSWGERGRVAGFIETDFADSWLQVLNSRRLKELADSHGLRVVFAPHPNIAMYLDELHLPGHIIAADTRAASYQDLLAEARVAITDYSTTAAEVAYLGKPIIYFQFDEDEVFSGEHTFKSGYFSYRRDGFGPVETRADDVITRLEDALTGREDPQFDERRCEAFPMRDGRCCERVYIEILALKGEASVLPHSAQIGTDM